MAASKRPIRLLMFATDASQRIRGVVEVGFVAAILMALISLAVRALPPAVIRAQQTEAAFLVATIKADVVAYYAVRGEWPQTNADVPNSTLAEPDGLGRFVDRIELGPDGTLTSVFGLETSNVVLQERRLTYRPRVTTAKPSSPVGWNCAQYRPPVGMQSIGTDVTDIDNRHLSFICRD
ncbi:MAG: pilin [Pseudomonadota bacterium]